MSPPLSETEEQQKAGSSSTADVDEDGSGTSEDIDAEAIELIGQGKRNLVVGDPPAAVQCLQEACALLAGKYGEMADECGEVYYQYGCALLELASLENGVLGNALQGVPDESADSDDDDEGAGDVEKKTPSNVESADTLEEKEREEVIQQVQDALEATCESEESEKEKEGDEEGEKKEGEGDTEEEEMETGEGGEDKDEESGEKEGEKVVGEKKGEKEQEKEEGEKKELEKREKEQEKEEGKKKEVVEEESTEMDDATEGGKEESAKLEEGKDKKEVKEDKHEEAKKVEEGKDEKVKEEKKDGEVTKQKDEKEEDGKPKDEKEKDDKAESQKKDDDEDDGAGPSKEKADGEGDEKDDEDDVPNFQLAWEMLELARLIISRQESKDCQLKVSQIHLKLGELGLETEQYAQSIIDFTSCLAIQKKYLEPESRQIAGTHYNLGLALSFAQKFDDSIENYRLSKELIEKRLEDLDKVVSETEGKGKAKADESDPIVSAQKEMDELKELLPDVVSKLEDAKEMKSQAEAGVSSDGAGPSSSTSSGFAPSSSAFDASSSSAPVQQISVKRPEAATASDISHLVRRKRKGADEEDGEEAANAAESKRSRQEDSADKTTSEAMNGSGDAKAVSNGQANGDAKDELNGHMNGQSNGDVVANGDAQLSPEKPSEIKTKKVPTDEAPTAMETA